MSDSYWSPILIICCVPFTCKLVEIVNGDQRWKAEEVGEKTHGDSEQKRKRPFLRADQISDLGSTVD